MKKLLKILGILFILVVGIAIYIALTWYYQFKVKPQKELKAYEGTSVHYPLIDNKFELPKAVKPQLSIPSDHERDHENELGLRKTISLNGTWEIAEGTFEDIPQVFNHNINVPGFADMAYPPFDKAGETKPSISFRALLPSQFMSIPRFEDEHREAFWYKKTFSLDSSEYLNATIKIHRAKYGSAVWLNGKKLGENHRNFQPGYYNISSLIKFNGAQNELIVRVGTSVTFTSNNKNVYGDVLEKRKQLPGIYDNVELILSNNPKIEKIQIVPQIGSQSVRVIVWIMNHDKLDMSAPIKFTIKEVDSEKIVGMAQTSPIQFKSNTQELIDVEVPLDHMKLWSPENPFLYTLNVQSSGDELNTPFGMREFHFDPESSLPILNDEIYFLRGTSVPIFRFAEDPLRGDKLWDEQWVRKVFRKFKEMNWNTIRFHVGPAPSMWYRIADEEGMIIQDEYAIWTFSFFRQGIPLDTIVAEYVGWMEEQWNHASLLIWDAQNESTQAVEPRTGWALNMVRSLDLSQRAWDNGWGDVQKKTDTKEMHPYMFTGSMMNMFGDKVNPLPEMGTLNFTSPDSLLISDSGNPVLVNEYAWLWIRRDGEPTELTQKGYDQHFPGFSSEDRFEYYARICAQQTEYYRALRAAGVMQFAGLNNNYPGCKTSDIFIDIQDLIIEPNIKKYVKDAFAPVGLCIWNWSDTIRAGFQADVPIIVVNDTNEPWTGSIYTCILFEDDTLYNEKITNICVDPSGKIIETIQLEYPGKTGVYNLVSSLTHKNNHVFSYRRFAIK